MGIQEIRSRRHQEADVGAINNARLVTSAAMAVGAVHQSALKSRTETRFALASQAEPCKLAPL